MLPFDGNSFFTLPRWEKLRAGLRRAAEQGATYLTLPLVRTVSVSPSDAGAADGDLWRLPDVAEPGELQVALQLTLTLTLALTLTLTLTRTRTRNRTLTLAWKNSMVP